MCLLASMAPPYRGLAPHTVGVALAKSQRGLFIPSAVVWGLGSAGLFQGKPSGITSWAVMSLQRMSSLSMLILAKLHQEGISSMTTSLKSYIAMYNSSFSPFIQACWNPSKSSRKKQCKGSNPLFMSSPLYWINTSLALFPMTLC